MRNGGLNGETVSTAAAGCSWDGSTPPGAKFEAGEVFEELGAVAFEVVVGQMAAVPQAQGRMSR
jgi:hypothetical protein